MWMTLCAERFGLKTGRARAGALALAAHDSLVRAGSEVAYQALVACAEDVLNSCLQPAGALAARWADRGPEMLGHVNHGARRAHASSDIGQG
jgi:hypothetical protein